MPTNFEPEGDLVTGPPARMPEPQILGLIEDNLMKGLVLMPLFPEHAQELYTNLGGSQNDHLYKYMPDGPFHDLESFTKHISFLTSSSIFSPFAIFSADARHLSNQGPQEYGKPGERPATAVGIICLMNMRIEHRSVEIGHILFPTTLQKTTEATEACYLLMKYAFEGLGYERVEWKCNDRNKGSTRAAERLAFRFEGVHRKHMVVKGRRRDTAWFSVLDGEWFGREVEEGKVGVRDSLEKWLDEGNFDGEGRQRKKLEEIREGK